MFKTVVLKESIRARIIYSDEKKSHNTCNSCGGKGDCVHLNLLELTDTLLGLLNAWDNTAGSNVLVSAEVGNSLERLLVTGVNLPVLSILGLELSSGTTSEGAIGIACWTLYFSFV